jgi:hypothetical protein
MKVLKPLVVTGIICTLFLAEAGSTFGQTAPPPVVDSALMDRVTALEDQAAHIKPGDDHFMVVGLATFGFVSNKLVNTLNGTSTTFKTNSLADAQHFEFSPMLLWRHGSKFLLEFEPSFNNDGLSVNWGDISYFAAPGLIVRGGYFVIPFGLYNKRLAAGWINKLATDPIGLGSPNSTDYGLEVEGGLPLGNMKWNYDFAVTNGMKLLPDGELQSAGITDNNQDKTLSGRLGLLPFSNSSLEIGISGLSGSVGDALSRFQNTRANMFAFDLNFVKTVSPFLVNVKGQYTLINIDHQDYTNPNDTTQTYTFNDKTTTYFAQMSLRPTTSTNDILKNLEVAFRYANYSTPANSLWGQNSNQVGISLNYWLNWRTVLKLTHETITGNSTVNKLIGPDGGNTNSNSWFLQFSIQL